MSGTTKAFLLSHLSIQSFEQMKPGVEEPYFYFIFIFIF
jgi:hypothetical protein